MSVFFLRTGSHTVCAQASWMSANLSKLLVSVCALGWVVGSAHAQQAIPQDGFISLMDTPIMQQPIQQGTNSLLPMQSPKPAVPAGDWGGAMLNSTAQTRTLCEAAVTKVADGQPRQAFDLLAPYWPMSKEEVNRLATQTDAQLKQLTASYGPIVGYEWVRTREAGKSLVRHWYLVKMQYHALRISCTFYKPAQTWQVHTVFWDDQLDELFEP